MVLRSRLQGSIVAAGLVLTLAGCAVSLRNPDIADLQRHPGRYQDRTVSVSGVVTNSWGVPLVPFRFYKVDDGTGEVTVLAQDGRVPSKGTRVSVRGRVDEVGMFGGQAFTTFPSRSKIPAPRRTARPRSATASRSPRIAPATRRPRCRRCGR